MILPILQVPDPRLREVAGPLVMDEDVIKPQIIQDMRDTFAATKGCIGLAATQLGLGWRAIIVDVTPRRTRTYLMLNPVILKASVDTQPVRDGCMSIDNGKTFANTRRPKRLEAEWLDEDGGNHREKFQGLLAACIHHEIDHLNGVLFTDQFAGDSGGCP